jgi:hypothetical protein
LNYAQALALVQFAVSKKSIESIDEVKMTFTNGTDTYTLIPLQDAGINQYFQSLTGTAYSFTVKTKDGYEIPRFDEFPSFDNDVELIFPAFIPALMSAGFAYRLELLLQEWMPIHLSWRYRFFGGDQLAVFIPFFAHIYNSLIYQLPKATHE